MKQFKENLFKKEMLIFFNTLLSSKGICQDSFGTVPYFDVLSLFVSVFLRFFMHNEYILHALVALCISRDAGLAFHCVDFNSL